MEPYRHPAEQLDPDRGRGPTLNAAPAAPWWALRRRWRWWLRLGSPRARRRREALRAQRRDEAEVDRMAHQHGIPRERVEMLRSMNLMPSQLLAHLEAFVAAMEHATSVARQMRDINPWSKPEVETEYAFGRREPKKRWRRTREGRLVRE